MKEWVLLPKKEHRRMTMEDGKNEDMLAVQPATIHDKGEVPVLL
jgi:hypothetical protein